MLGSTNERQLLVMNNLVILGDCDPLTVSNGTIEYNTIQHDSGDYLAGTIATLSCDHDFIPEEPSSVICEITEDRTGEWSGELRCMDLCITV